MTNMWIHKAAKNNGALINRPGSLPSYSLSFPSVPFRKSFADREGNWVVGVARADARTLRGTREHDGVGCGGCDVLDDGRLLRRCGITSFCVAGPAR